jgi:hypothetical protein
MFGALGLLIPLITLGDFISHRFVSLATSLFVSSPLWLASKEFIGPSLQVQDHQDQVRTKPKWIAIHDPTWRTRDVYPRPILVR